MLFLQTLNNAIYASSTALLQRMSHIVGMMRGLLALLFTFGFVMAAQATTFTETVPNGHGPIPNTYPPVGGTMFVLVGTNGNIYYQFVNPSTQFQGFAGTGTPAAFRGIPVFQLGPQQNLNCGIVSCSDYFGGSIAEGYARLTVRDADACPGNFDYQDVSFEVNGLPVSSLSDLGPNDVQRTNLTGTTQVASTEDCFRNQGTAETSTGWFDLPGNVLTNILSVGSTTPYIRDDDTGSNTTRGDNAWFFQDGVDATGTPEVAPGVEIIKTSNVPTYTNPGDVIIYNFEVTNIGSVTLNDIVVSDAFITGAVTCPQTSLVSGAVMDCSAEHIVTQQNIDDNITFVNEATVTANPTEGQLGSVSGQVTVTGPAADNSMTITKKASKDTNVEVGDVITYTYEIQNTGNITLDNVTVTDVHGGTGILGPLSPASVTLAPNASQVFTAAYTVTQADFDAGGTLDNTATANATPKRGTISEPIATESISYGEPKPEAKFSKIASPDADLDVGDTVTYTYTAYNVGNVTLNNVSVSDIHGGSGTLSAINPASASVAPGATQAFTATYVVTQDDVDAGVDIENIATLSAKPAQGAWTDIEAKETVGMIYVPRADLVTVKTLASGNSTPDIGDIVSFDITVTNNGPEPTTNISLTDLLPSGLIAMPDNGTVTAGSYNDTSGDWTIASLANGASATLTLEGMIQVSAAGTTITNTTSAATSDLPDDTATGDQLTAGVNVNGATPDTSDSPNQCGAFTSKGWLTFGSTRTDWTQIPGTGNPSSDFYLYLPLTRLPSGEIVSYFGAPDENVTGNVPSPAGSNLISTNINNAGHQSEYHVSVIRLEGTANTSETITLATANAHDWTAYWIEDSAGNIIDSADFVFTATTSANGSVGPNLPITVNYPSDEIVYLNVAMFDPTGGYGPPRINNYTCPEADLATVKTLTSGNATPDLGDTVSFDITVTNNGPSDAINTTLTDLLPAGLTATANNGTVTTGTYDAATGGWTIANLANGATATLTLEGTVDLAAAGTTITNITTAAISDVPDSTPTGDTLEASVDVLEAMPAMTLTKTASNDTDAQVGDVITYTYVAENTGNVDMTNISITDVHGGTGSLGAITPANVAALAVGDSTTFTAMYTVTQDDVDAGTAISNTATANASPALGTYTPSTAMEEVTIEAPTPLAELTKTASDTTDVIAGQVITYTYSVKNTGNVLLTNVEVTDSHNGNGTLGPISPASVASLPVGQTATFTANYTVVQADIEAGIDITNTATATATPSRGSLPETTADEAVDVVDPASGLSMVKTATTADFEAVGDVVSYTYEVTNTGNVSISAVSVTDDKIASVNCPSTSIAPTESVTCTAEYTITQDDLDAGSVTNNAEATGTPTGGTPPTTTATETVDGTQSPAMTMTKTALDTDFTAVGDTLDYEYLVTNTGNVAITALSVTDDKIATINCPVTVLAPTEQTTCMGTYTVTQADLDAGQVINNAEADGTPAGGTLTPAAAQETVGGTQEPKLEIAKSALTTDFTAIGDTIDYSYEVTNTGNVTITNAISVDDDKITIPGIVSCPAIPAGGLLPNASIICTATYVVTQADLDAGFVTNTASATDGTTTSPTDQATVTGTQSPAMTLLKEPVETSYTAVGDMINYNYTVTNTGNVLIANLSVTDDLISVVTCNVSSAGNGDANLDPAEVVVCTGIYEVTQEDLDNGSVTNNASATGTPPGGTLTPPVTDATVNAEQKPELTMTKTAGESSFDAVGDILTYEYKVENTGNVFVTSITVADDKISTVTCDVAAIGNNDANLDPSETVICTAQYTVTQDDLDAGQVTNNASATGSPAGGTLVDAEATETVNADQNPALETVKTATNVNFELPGDVTTYEYVVTNTGNVTLTDPITVSDNLISSVSCPALPAGGLAPLGSITCTASYVVTQADLDNGSVTNLASASSGLTSSLQSSETIPADQAPALEIEKAALFTDFTAAGETVEYEYIIRNTGNLTLTGGINVVDDKIGTINCVVGNLVPMGVETCRASYIITQDDMDAGEVTNQAYAQNGTLTSPPVDVTVSGSQTSALTFDKRALTATFTKAGDVLSYEFDVKNTGNVTLTGVVVNDDLIATVSCPQSTLAPNEDMVCLASYMVTQDDVDAGEVINNASASGNPPTGPPTSTPDSETVDSSAAPGLSFVKRAIDTDFTMAGDVLDYAFDLENTGTITLSNIVVTDDLISTVNCPLTALAPNGTMTCTASYTVTQDDIDSGSVTNNAAANADLPDGTAIPEETDMATVTGTQSPSMTVDKEAVTTDYTMVGDTLDYTYTVQNTGNVNITAITVVDDLIPSLSCPATALAPNATLECTGQYTVTQADINNGFVTNNVTANGTPAGGMLSPASDQVTVMGTQNPGLGITKTAATPSFDSVNDTVDYEYVVTNTGNVTLIDPITIADDKISSVSCPALPSGGLLPNGTLTCTATYVVTQSDIDAGQVTNIASASDGTTTSPDVSETVNADQMPSLATSKTASPQTYTSVGQTVSYIYIVTNTGNVTITAPISVTDDKIASVTCPALPPTGLAPNATLTCTGDYSVTQSDLDSGSVTNMATSTDGTTTSSPVEEVVTADQMPSLTIAKDAQSTSFSALGELIDYDYTVTNSGNVTITAPVSVTDDKISAVSCPALPGGDLVPGESLVCSATYAVTQDDLDAGFITNTASASSGGTTSPQVSETVNADQLPDLGITKTALTSSFTMPGDTIDYEYRVRNTGNVTLNGNVMVADDKISAVACPSLPMAGLAPNGEIVCTATYVVTQADIDAGTVTNIATASNGGTTSPQDTASVNADQNPALTTVKRALETTFDMPGDTIDYEYDVINTGNTTIIDPISVADDRIASVTCPALPSGGLAPMAQITCTGTYTVVQADIDAGEVTNIASATDGTTTSPDVSRSVFATRVSELEIEKNSLNINFNLPGDVTSYEYVVTNSGNVTITDPITINDNLIPASNLSCPALPTGGLAPGAAITCMGTYEVTQDNLDVGAATNVATATDGNIVSSPDSETIPANQNPEMEMRKTSSDTSFSMVGEVLTYDFEIKNTGNITLTGNVDIVDNKIGTFTCFSGNFPSVAPGNVQTCQATYTVTQEDIDNGFVTNDAFASHPLATSPPDFVTIPADQTPVLTLVKTATTTSYAAPGDALSYTFEVTNDGNTTITFPIEVSDSRIPNVVCPALPSGGLPPTQSITCTGTDIVTQADIDAGVVENTASATDGTTTSTPQTESVDAVQTPELSVNKIANDNDFVAVGDVLNYTFIVTNSGNVTLTSPISVEDSRIGTVTCPALPAGGLAPNQTLTCIASDTVSQDDLNAGFVTNTATATDGTNTSDPDEVTVSGTQEPSLDIDKTANETSYAAVGDLVTYDYLVTNTGNVTLTSAITVADDKIASVNCPSLPAGGLIPTATLTCTGSYSVTQEDIDAGQVTNIASASDGTTTSPTVSETVSASQSPNLTLRKTATVTEFDTVGDTLTYDYVITNSGNVTLTSAITINDDRIAAVSCPALPSGGLVPGATLTCTGTDTISQADLDLGTVTNTATATDGTTTSAPVSETVVGNQTNAFTVDKLAMSNDFTAVGDVLTYNYVVRNTGNVSITTPVTINDDKIGMISCPALPTGGLVPNATLTCSADYAVTQDDLNLGQVTNIAVAQSGGATSQPDDVTVTGTQEPALSILKTAGATSFSAVGEIVSYEYLVTNIGNVMLTNAITVSDDKIANVSCPSLPTGGLIPAGTLTCSANYTITQADLDAGEVTNIATASDGTTVSGPMSVTVAADQTSGLMIEKSAVTAGFNMPGDIVSYEYVVTNTGNTTLLDAIAIADDKIANVTCPALPSGGLAPQQMLTCAADYTVTQADIDAGEVTNIASATAGGTTSAPDEVTVEAMRMPQLAVTKSVSETIQVGGPIYDITYQITMENTGNVTLTNLQLEDDLASFLAPAVIYDTPVVAVSGITGASANSAYDGAGDITLLSGTPELPVGEMGLVTIIVRIDTTEGGPAQGNTAMGSSDILSAPVPSNDPNVTPGADDDVNPTPLSIVDTDGDGSPDNFESSTEDRDGDGIPDSEDYDPTGYFYCEENGQILSGGGISVSGPAGVNASIGTANNIVIVEDGSSGYFQFYVTAPGRYIMTPTYPATGVASTARPVQNVALDATSLLPNNPAVLGSSEVGNTGELADASAAANTPFYFEFDFEAGDPAILMNNIPLQHCGRSELTLAKSVMGDPVTQDDGRQLITYLFNVSNTGETQMDNIQISDDLGDVYGDANVMIDTNEITEEPVNFAGNEDMAYDGVNEITLLDGLGSLKAGESMSVQLQALVTPETASTFINKASVEGANPLTGDIVSADDTASIELIPSAKVNNLIVRKTARPRTVQIGDPVLYTISVTNSGVGTISNIDIVDNIPEGFAYIPNSARVSDGTISVNSEPVVTNRSDLKWGLDGMKASPLDYLAPGETLSVDLRLLAGPNVEFGAHENQAYVENRDTGERSEIATAIVEYIPEPSFDCTPIIGRVYDDVNHNGYPDDGEPGLPNVRLVTVNGDIITTDQYGRYHIPCAIIANNERGSNFLLKADTRTLPLGYSPTTENPRVIRATRGKFAKMNFGAAHRPKLRVDLFTADFDDESRLMLPEAARRVTALLKETPDADRAILVYHADDLENVDTAQDALQLSLKVVRELAPKQFRDIALEASWGDAAVFTAPASDTKGTKNLAIGQLFEGPASPENRDRVPFFEDDDGDIYRSDFDAEGRDDHFGTADRRGDRFQNREAGLRGDDSSAPLSSDTRPRGVPFAGRGDSGDIDSARPGRLLRWIGWGNNITAYSEGLEIETTSDSLDPVKRLNVQANIVSGEQGRLIRAEGYWNYDAFIERAELRIFDAARSTRGKPISVAEFANGEVMLNVNTNMPREESNSTAEMLYVLRVYSADGSYDETAPKALHLGDAEFDMTEEEWQRESSTAFGQNTLLISNITVRGGAVRVYGRNVPGQTVTVMGQDIQVDADGKFVSEQLLPAGEQAIEITVDGINDTTKRIIRTVDVKTRDTFYVAQIEATIGENIAEDSSGKRDFQEGRLAFYVRSRLNERWAVTATADTGEADIENLFSGLDDKDLGQLLRRLDPDRYYPVYGDDSTIEQDAPTSGRIYARIERDDDYALWGNYQTNFNDTEFARVQRTLYGAKLHWDENGNPTKFGDDRTRLTAFIAEGGSRQGRDELRGTGGSVYYLRHGDISIGSEILRVETRDSVSGLVLETRRLVYGTDYDMDFIQGRVILNQPLRSTANDGRLFRDGSQSGHETLLVVDYEFSPVFGASDDAAVYGVRGSRWFGNHVKLGATYNHDTDGGAESDLYEIDLTLQYAAGTYIKGEFAKTEGLGVQTFRSIDGGFTYNPQDRGGLSDNTKADGYALEAAIDFTEVDGINLDGTSYAYWRKRDAGFAGYSEATNQAIEQFGGGINLDLSQDLTLSARADVSDDKTLGTNSFVEATLDYDVSENITATAGVSFNDDARGNSGTSLGGRVEYDLGDDSSVYAFGQVGIEGDNTRTTDRIGAGAEVRLSKNILGGGEISTGEDGLGARASLRYQYEDGDEYYLAYDLPLRSQVASNLGTFNFGARRRYTDALSVYGEERFQFNEQGLNGITHAYGLDYKPGNWNLGLAAEVGRVDELDREAFSANVGYADERMKAGITGEWREDENVTTGDKRRTWLLRSTARYEASDELRLQGKLNLAFSDQERDSVLGPQDFNKAEFTEASIAAAYRPIWDDRFNLLGKLVWLEDLSPTSQRFNGETLNYRQKSSIASIDASYDIAPRWTLGGKYAHRAGSVTSNRESLDFTKSQADLAVLRLDYHATHRWDAVLEGRYLDIGNGVITRKGGLAGVYRHVNDNAKIGVGLTWGGIEEEYLAVTGKEDELGWYLNVIGKF